MSKDIISVSIKDSNIQNKESMTLDEARFVLQAVVSTNESSITSQTSLDQVAGFTTDQIRQAVDTVTHDLFRRTLHSISHLHEEIYKGKPSNALELSVYKPSDDQNHFASVRLVQYNGRYEEISFLYPIDPDYIGDVNVSFIDTRKDESQSVSLSASSALGKPITLENYRLMVRGLRWLSANILNWEKPGMILPEQLDHLSLPPASIE